jgi:two-component system, OmpR family, sensor histidine kinase KdpD
MPARSLRLGREIVVAALAIGVATAAGVLLGVNPTTFALVLFTLVLFLGAWRGVGGGILASLLATACLNFFFLPPLHTWHIEDPENWVALGCFLVASILAGRIVTYAAHIEALRESDALKTSLLRAVSHDLTTPLTAIALQTGQLRRRSAPELQPSIDALEMEVDRLRRRIDGLLAMARLEAGALTPSTEPTPPADLFRAVRENLSLIARSRPIAARVEPDCPDLDIDPSLALEILVNLVENAHRSSPAGEPVTLHAQRHPAEPRLVRLEILDRGPGIALLSPGSRSDVPSDVAHRGLGLEIAQGLARALHGTVTLANRDGGGTVAQVDLPAAEPAATMEANGPS